MTTVADNVLETTTTTGLSDYLLEGAPDVRMVNWGDVYADSDEVYYAAAQDGGGFEVGKGIFKANPSRIERSKVYTSSAGGGALVNWGAGRKIVYSNPPAFIANQWPRVASVLGVAGDAPVSPIAGDRWLTDDFVTGGWGGAQPNSYATYDGAVWEFDPLAIGDMAILETGGLYMFRGDRNLEVTSPAQEPQGLYDLPATVVLDDWNDDYGARMPALYAYVRSGVLDSTLSIPPPDSMETINPHRITVKNTLGVQIQVDVDGGIFLIEGASSLAVTPGQAVTLAAKNVTGTSAYYIVSRT